MFCIIYSINTYEVSAQALDTILLQSMFGPPLIFYRRMPFL